MFSFIVEWIKVTRQSSSSWVKKGSKTLLLMPSVTEMSFSPKFGALLQEFLLAAGYILLICIKNQSPKPAWDRCDRSFPF